MPNENPDVEMFVKCKVCGWDLATAMGKLEGPVFSSPAVADQAAITYAIFTGHMQTHIYDALIDIEDAIRKLRFIPALRREAQ